MSNDLEFFEKAFGEADPAGQPLDVVRDIRDDIQARVTTLLRQILS